MRDDPFQGRASDSDQFGLGVIVQSLGIEGQMAGLGLSRQPLCPEDGVKAVSQLLCGAPQALDRCDGKSFDPAGHFHCVTLGVNASPKI